MPRSNELEAFAQAVDALKAAPMLLKMMRAELALDAFVVWAEAVEGTIAEVKNENRGNGSRGDPVSGVRPGC